MVIGAVQEHDILQHHILRAAEDQAAPAALHIQHAAADAEAAAAVTAIATEFMDLQGNRSWIEGEAQGFSYRNSSFQGREGVILRTRFQLKPGKEEEIRGRIFELNEKRRSSQPLDKPSAGSTFKRPAQGYAAALIQEAGLKGYRYGDAAVSDKHAGFVVNLGNATAKEVLTLVEQVQEKVLEHSGIRLEPEVRLWARD
jgi:UDP-N-acetylmuramate dehydrogenase